MDELNETVSRMDAVLHDMPGVCDGCSQLVETNSYSFDGGDVKLCANCTTESPWMERLYDQHVDSMKTEQRDNDAKLLRTESWPHEKT
jgi:hypothetical protein